MTQTIPEEIIRAAESAGMHNVADLAMADFTKLTRDAAGRVDAAGFVQSFRAAKPHLFAPLRRAREMSADERAARLREITAAARAPRAPAEPAEPLKRARDLSPTERAARLRELTRHS